MAYEYKNQDTDDQLDETETVEENEESEDACVDSQGNALTSGDEVSVIKDLKVGGTKLTIKKGTVIKNIKLTGDPEEVECRYDNMKGIVLRTEFLRKRT